MSAQGLCPTGVSNQNYVGPFFLFLHTFVPFCWFQLWLKLVAGPESADQNWQYELRRLSNFARIGDLTSAPAEAGPESVRSGSGAGPEPVRSRSNVWPRRLQSVKLSSNFAPGPLPGAPECPPRGSARLACQTKSTFGPFFLFLHTFVPFCWFQLWLKLAADPESADQNWQY